MNLTNKRIVITGAASGIGAALLNLLEAYDCQIVVADLDTVENPDVHSFTGDLSQQEENARLFDFALEKMGGVDLFIANAGFVGYGSIKSADWDRIEKLYQVNVFAPLYAVARMAEINPENPYMVAITASAMAHIAIPGYAYYAGTKAALHRFADGYRFEMPDNAHLLLIYPIATRTSFFDSVPVIRPSQTPEYVAKRILNGILKNKKSVTPSTSFRLTYLLERWFPGANRLYQRYGLWLLNRWEKNR